MILKITNISLPKIKLIENSSSAKFPDLQKIPLVNIPKQLDSWFKYNLALRDQFLALYIKIWQVYLCSPNGRQYTGNNEEMFINVIVSQYASNYMTQWGLIELDKEHIIRVKLYYNGMAAYFKLHNIPYYLLIIPDKHTLYPQKMPFYTKWSSGQNYYSIFRKIFNESKIQYIDMLEILQKNNTLFYNKRFDVSHWNANALNISYKIIVNILKQNKILQHQDNITDFYKIIYINKKYNAYPMEQVPFLHIQRTEELSDQTNKYSYLNSKIWPWAQTSLLINPKKNKGTLCLVTDSYFMNADRFPLKSVKRTITPLAHLVHKYIHLHYFNAVLSVYDKIVSDHRPDVVIEAFVERMRGNVERTRDPRLRIFAECELKTPGYFLTPQMLSTVTVHGGILRSQDEESVLEARNNNPFITLPPVTTDTDGRAMVAARIISPHQTMAQLFYATPGKTFSGLHSTSVKLNKGDNLVHLYIITEPHQRVILRFDPASHKGIYRFLPLPWVNKLMGGQYGL